MSPNQRYSLYLFGLLMLYVMLASVFGNHPTCP